MIALAALCAGLAAVALIGPSREGRVRRLWTSRRSSREPPPVPVLAGFCAAAAVILYLDGAARVPLAAAAGVGTWYAIRRSERARVDEDPELVAAVPVFVDLVVAGLRAGRPPAQAVRVAAEAVGAPMRDAVLPCLPFDGDWRMLAAHPVLGRLGRALQRSAYSGAPVTDTVARLAEELRRDTRSRAEDRARRVAVRTVGPLGACFLPAFLLVGVVPTIVSAFAALTW